MFQYIDHPGVTALSCPLLKTRMLSLLFLFLESLTNDMPVVDPKGFDTFRLVPFQINRIFKKGNAPVELSPADDFSFLL